MEVNKSNQPTSFINKNKIIKFTTNSNSSLEKLYQKNLPFTNSSINFDSNAHTNIYNLNKNLYSLESQKENQTSPFEQIRSNKKPNIRFINCKNQKNSFRNYLQSKSFNIPQYFRLTNKKTIYEENEKNNVNDLIKYKKVLYSSFPIQYNNKLANKAKQYNKEIRKRNDIKNLRLKSSKEKDNIKHYSFYKYEKYMEKIEKEEINAYKTMQKKKKEINIQKIFNDKSSNTKSKMNSNISKNNSINIIKGLNKSIASGREILIQSNKSLLLSNILSNKNEINENNSYSNNKSLFVRIPIKNSSKNLIFNDDSDNSGTSEFPIIINNYQVKRTGIRKLKKTNTVMFRNVLLNQFRKEQKLFDSEEISESSKGLKSAKANKIGKMELLNLSDDLDKRKKNNRDDKIKFEKIKPAPMKNEEKKVKDKEIFENVRKNYFQTREKMIRITRKNLFEQKLLFNKILKIDKNKNKNKKNKSKFNPFYNLNYKHEVEETGKRKKILNKYYIKNLEQNQFSVRLKNKSRMSFITNNNNSINASQINLVSQVNDLKSEYFSVYDYFNNENENSYRNIEDKNKYIIKVNQDENLFNLKEIENIDNIINFDGNEKEEIKNVEEKNKIKLDEMKLSEMIKGEKKKEFENEIFKKYEKAIKNNEKKEGLQKKLITNEMLEEASNRFFSLLKENEKIIESSKKAEEAELFIEFREKMNSLAKYSKRELNLYIFRNYQVINNLLEECKRDKQRENRINGFIQILREDLEEIYNRREYILKFLKVLDYQPFPNYTLNDS